MGGWCSKDIFMNCLYISNQKLSCKSAALKILYVNMFQPLGSHFDFFLSLFIAPMADAQDQ